MADISIQFHACPSELLTLASEIVDEFQLHVVAIRLFPFVIKEIHSSDLESLTLKSPAFRRLAFMLDRPNLSVKDGIEFTARNPDHLRLDLAAQTEKGLEQAWLTARTSDVNALLTWRKIASKVKKMTQQGVIAINPKTGATSNMKSFRYTKAAKELELKGIPMLPPAGTSVIRLGCFDKR